MRFDRSLGDPDKMVRVWIVVVDRQIAAWAPVMNYAKLDDVQIFRQGML